MFMQHNAGQFIAMFTQNCIILKLSSHCYYVCKNNRCWAYNGFTHFQIPWLWNMVFDMLIGCMDVPFAAMQQATSMFAATD
jgi:hypothetical protein